MNVPTKTCTSDTQSNCKIRNRPKHFRLCMQGKSFSFEIKSIDRFFFELKCFQLQQKCWIFILFSIQWLFRKNKTVQFKRKQFSRLREFSLTVRKQYFFDIKLSGLIRLKKNTAYAILVNNELLTTIFEPFAIFRAFINSATNIRLFLFENAIF